MLPDEGPLTETQVLDVLTAVKDYIARHGITYAEIARQIGGVRPSTIGEVLAGKYSRVKPETRDGHVRDLNNWMEVDARRRATRPQRKFVETGVAVNLITLAEQAVSGQFMAIAHGPTGIGKTMVAHAIVDRYPGAMYLRVSRGNTTHMALRRLLAKELHISDPRGLRRDRRRLTFDEMVFNILRDSGRLLVVDEAHRLADSGLEFLRDLYDECHVPIVLLATKDLVRRLEEDKDEDHGQLFSRFAMFLELTRGADKTPGSRKPLFSIADIRRIYESDKVRLLPDGQRYLQDVANMLGHGSLRRCDWIVKWAVSLVRRRDNLGPEDRVNLDAEALRSAEKGAMRDDAMTADIDHRERIRTAVAG
ncbi:MAG: AAA family ATPase [Phycisphaerae bacterium]|nr:AAA family ATPase [Phycisphaerae bacterium]